MNAIIRDYVSQIVDALSESQRCSDRSCCFVIREVLSLSE
jgi:hypothetical protein